MKYDKSDLMSVLLEPFGPGDKEVADTAKYKFEQYNSLFHKLGKQDNLDLSSEEKEIIMDAFRMFLEGVMDADINATTGKDKNYFLDLYAHLLKDWGMEMPKLKRQSFDSPEYQEKATQSGLVEEQVK